MVMPLNKPAGISVNDVQPLNVWENFGIRPSPVPNCGNIAPSDPEIDATLAAVAPENDIAASYDPEEYCVAVPPNRTVCAPADAHVHVYIVEYVDVRLTVLSEIVLPEVVFCVNVPPSPQSTKNVPLAVISHFNSVASFVVVTENFAISHCVPSPKTSISSAVHANAFIENIATNIATITNRIFVNTLLIIDM